MFALFNLKGFDCNLEVMYNTTYLPFLKIIFFLSGPEEEDDEPLLSGSGAFERSYSDGEMDNWKDVLEKWRDTNTRPNKLTQAVRRVSSILVFCFSRKIAFSIASVYFKELFFFKFKSLFFKSVILNH